MATTRINGLQQFSTTGPVSFNSQRITDLQNPTQAQDAATKFYVDSVAVGLNVKDQVKVATTQNITLSGTQTIDGIALSQGDRVLVKNQTTQTQNGIYVVAVGSWQRSQDADEDSEVKAGLFVFVEKGTTQADTGWVLTSDNPITLGTTNLTFAQFSGAGSYLAGNGLELTGVTFSVKTVSTGRITVAAGGIDLAASGVTGGTYGNLGFNVPNIQIDTYGRITSASNRDLFPAKVANNVFAGPTSGVNQVPDFRLLVFADMIGGLVNGGTPATIPTNGQLMIGNGQSFTLNTLTAGTAVSISNGSGTITINNTGVTQISGTPLQITASASTGSVTLSFPSTGVTLPQKTTLGASTAGYASLNIPTGVQPTSPNVGDIWLIQATGIWARYGSTPTTYNLADISSAQTLTNKTLSNPTLSSISADGAEMTALLINGSSQMVTRELGTNAFNSTSYVTSVSGTANRITVSGTTQVTIDIASTYVGQTSITTLGTIATGTWNATTIQVNKGGTGQTSYTDGQLLIGNSTGNTLSKNTLTAGANISITNGSGTITIASAGSMQTANYKVRESLVGTVDGVNAVFAIGSPLVADKEMIFNNGLLQRPGAGNDYTISGQQVTFLTGSIPQTGDALVITYIAS